MKSDTWARALARRALGEDEAENRTAGTVNGCCLGSLLYNATVDRTV